jgi:hypothetical protein
MVTKYAGCRWISSTSAAGEPVPPDALTRYFQTQGSNASDAAMMRALFRREPVIEHLKQLIAQTARRSGEMS